MRNYKSYNLLAFASIFMWIAFTGKPCRSDPLPIPLFDVRFSPPIAEISAVNSGNRMLAVQVAQGSSDPARVLSIDDKGRATTLDDLSLVKEITVPPERLWIAGGQMEEGSSGSVNMPVTDVLVFLSGGGETYTVVYKTRGSYYELRHKDSRGRLLFIATPRDDYGLKSVIVSYDGKRVMVVDESPMTGSATGGFGQRLYLYGRDGRLLTDNEMGDDLDLWLIASEGLMAKDGGYFVAARGKGGRPGSSLVLFDERGRLKWEKTFFKAHKLMEDFGGIFSVKGGSLSFINFVDKGGELKVLERTGYGFDFWLSGDGKYAYIIVFKPFDLKKSRVEDWVKAAFPGVKVVALDLTALTPEGGRNPGVAIAPDGKAFIHHSSESLGRQDCSTLTYYDASLKEYWHDRFYDRVKPQFVKGGQGFLLKFGSPSTRLIYYGLRQRP